MSYRMITREEYKKLIADDYYDEEYYEEHPKELSERYRRNIIVSEDFSCNECGGKLVLTQRKMQFDAEIECLNPDCDNENILR